VQIAMAITTKPIDENITSFNANRLIGKFAKRIVEWF
jgi:hypothetical protein